MKPFIFTPWFGDVEPEDVVAQWQTLDAGMRETLVICGALLFIIIAVVVWAVFIRKSKHGSHPSETHSHHHRRAQPESHDSSRRGEKRSRRRRKKRGQHHEYTQRNPTLAETGGLPPVRSDLPPPPSEP